MSDNDVELFPEVEEMLESLGYSEDEIILIKQKVMEKLNSPEYQELLAQGIGYVDIPLDIDGLTEQVDLDIEVLDPEIREAMEELYFSDIPPTIH
jgi:hypothetical protein